MANDNEERVEEQPIKVSRRDFFIGAGAGIVTTGVIAGGYMALNPRQEQAAVAPTATPEPTAETAAAPAEAAPVAEAAPAPAAEVRSGKQLVTLKVNGQSYEVAVEPQVTLAEVLRRELGLTGTHLGCNGSYCSSCSVLVDGVAQNSCSLLAIREAGKEITTIEGLEVDGELHPVQQAFWEKMGYQCGFCTSGQIIRSVELLNKVKSPTEEQIRHHLSGNMCKCSAYPNIVKAVQHAAELMA
ncbi:MAG: (2Fe-2S)-binding protein [Caldilineaceae bacterium]